jgi:SAM-dependent methyltransferase
MMPLDYAALRMARRLMPEAVVAWLRNHRLFLVPGLETRKPAAAVDRYVEYLTRANVRLPGKRVMLLGYGGSFGVGIGLLRRGAKHVTLVDPYVSPSRLENERFLTEAPNYVHEVSGRIEVNEQWLSIQEGEVCQLAQTLEPEFDLVLSSSVLEHVIGLERLLECLRSLTAARGVGLHFVDLRDHFFKYPFEMLCHSDRIWRLLLEPRTRLNRKRLWEYEELFSTHFEQVSIEIINSDPQALAQARLRILPKYLSGDPSRDSACKIAVFCAA